MNKKPVLLATNNQGKLKELAELLKNFNLEVVGLKDFPHFEEVEENGATFEENALLKAKAACEHSGLYSIADDSGLCVDALNGAPGIYSARYAFMHNTLPPSTGMTGSIDRDKLNIEKLLAELQGVSKSGRQARFYCAIVACSPDGRSIASHGTWEGNVAFEPKGRNGFGYDPVFICNQSQKHAAELTAREKNARSHRSQALKNLLKLWPDFWR